jgi:hypothetical protein
MDLTTNRTPRWAAGLEPAKELLRPLEPRFRK